MIVYKCDGCGILSPDEKGLFIDNDWFEVNISSRKYLSYRERYMLCPKCITTKIPMGFWERIKSKFIKEKNV